jgi:parallel beta-helix repeat protein
LCGNTIISSGGLGIGIELIGFNTTQNEIIGNTIVGFAYGIVLLYADNNDIYYNNFLDNTTHAYTHSTSSPYNQWDDGGTYGGNYWGACTDSNCDGFCDSSYTIATGEVDNYPLANLSTRKCQ